MTIQESNSAAIDSICCMKVEEASAQIAVLLALTADLFDSVPLDQMKDAEHALREATADIPAEVSKRSDIAEKLSDEDRKTIIEIARKSLARFQSKAESKPKAEAQTDAKPKPKTEPEKKS